MEKRFQVWGLLFGATAIILGAFGAHALKVVLSPEQLTSFETGVKYQMYHGLFLLLLSRISLLAKKLILNLVVVGVLMFSCSIYLLNLKELIGLSQLKWLGPVTPIGGSILIFCWMLCIYKVARKQ